MIFLFSFSSTIVGILGDKVFTIIGVLGVMFGLPISIIGLYFGVQKRTKVITEKKQANFVAKYRREFKEEGNKEFICMICKLQIYSDELVYICPNCNSHYHEDHLNEWLKIERKCPVCDYDFTLN